MHRLQHKTQKAQAKLLFQKGTPYTINSKTLNQVISDGDFKSSKKQFNKQIEILKIKPEILEMKSQ